MSGKKDIDDFIRQVNKTKLLRLNIKRVTSKGKRVAHLSNKNYPNAPIEQSISNTASDVNAVHGMKRDLNKAALKNWGKPLSDFMNFTLPPADPLNPQERWANLMHILTQVMGFEESLIIYDDKEPPTPGVPFIVIVPTDTLHSKGQQLLLGSSGNYAILAGAYQHPKRKQKCGVAVLLVSQQKDHLKHFKDNLSPLGHLRY